MTSQPIPRPGASRVRPLLLPLIALALVAAACTGGAASPAPVATPAASPSPVASPPPSTAPQPVLPSEAPPEPGAVPDDVVAAAVADAAGRAGVDPSAVTVVSTEARDFSDGSLGCPEPGMMYTQAITPGYRVVVEAGGTRYDYRASVRGGAADVGWCERPPLGG